MSELCLDCFFSCYFWDRFGTIQCHAFEDFLRNFLKFMCSKSMEILMDLLDRQCLLFRRFPVFCCSFVEAGF